MRTLETNRKVRCGNTPYFFSIMKLGIQLDAIRLYNEIRQGLVGQRPDGQEVESWRILRGNNCSRRMRTSSVW